MFDGFTYRFIPIKNRTNRHENGFTDVHELYSKMTSVYSWESLKRNDWYVDYQNLYTFAAVMSQREIFASVALELIEAGEDEKAIEMLDMCQEVIPEANFPLDLVLYGFNNEQNAIMMVEAYYLAGAAQKASDLSTRLTDSILDSAAFFLNHYEYGKRYFDTCYNILAYVSALADEYGDSALATSIRDRFNNQFQ